MDVKVEMAIAAYEELLEWARKTLDDERNTKIINGLLAYTVGVIAGSMGKKSVTEERSRKLMADILGLINELE